MKTAYAFMGILTLLASLIPCQDSLGASTALLQAKEKAEANGYLFETGHDAIVEKARERGKFRAIISLEPTTIASLAKAFRAKYPALDVEVQEISGRAAAEVFLLELRTGRANWDVARLANETYSEHLKHAKKVDIWGMAEHGVLKIPSKMIDPKNRNVVATTSHLGTSAFNRCTLDASMVPKRWEDFLRPEFKGRKFAVDIRPLNFLPMVAAAGEEWTIHYAKSLAAQEPIWVRGHSRALASLLAGEFGLHQLTNWNTAQRIIMQKKDPRECFQERLIEPVPVRLSGPLMVVNTATNPHAALLWLEFMASAEAQHLIDEDDPKSSLYASDSTVEKAVRGKKVWVHGWDDFEKSDRWVQMIVEAFGFPKAERRRR